MGRPKKDEVKSFNLSKAQALAVNIKMGYYLINHPECKDINNDEARDLYNKELIKVINDIKKSWYKD